MGFPRRYRWALAVALAFGLLAALLVVLAHLRAEGRYTRAQYDRIRLDMTREEVHAVLSPAKPDVTPVPFIRPDDWQLDASDGWFPADKAGVLPPASRKPGEWWADSRGAIWVIYTGEEERRVEWKGRLVPDRGPSFWQRLRHRLGLEPPSSPW